MNETEHLNIPIPDPAAEPPTNINAEFERLRLAWQMVDLILYNLQITLADKANVDHTQAMATVTGLVDALANKMAADREFKLDDLTDVAGADEAAVNYVLVKTPTGWVPSTAIAALGLHNHLINEVSGLVEALLAKADLAATAAALAAKLSLAGGAMTGPIENAIFAAPGANTKRAHFDLTAVVAGQDRIIRIPNFDTSTSIWEPIGVYDFTGLGTTGQLIQNLGAYRDLRFRADYRGSGSNTMAMQVSDDNGVTFITSANYTRGEMAYIQVPSNAVVGGAVTDTVIFLGTSAPGIGMSVIMRGELVGFNKAHNKVLDGSWHTNGASGNVTAKLGYVLTMLNTLNALKIFASAGTVDGRFVLEGIRG